QICAAAGAIGALAFGDCATARTGDRLRLHLRGILQWIRGVMWPKELEIYGMRRLFLSSEAASPPMGILLGGRLFAVIWVRSSRYCARLGACPRGMQG